MAENESTLKKKLSPLIEGQSPDFVRGEHDLFVKFVKDYYRFLESGELVLSGTINNIIQETDSTNYIIDSEGDRIVTEDSTITFTAGETITGSTSKATATVLVSDVDSGNKRLFISAQQKFITGETITGSTSSSSGTIVSYRGNPVQNIQQLLEYADADNTIYDFLENMRNSFLQALPYELATGVDKRKLIRNIRDLYSAKGTSESHKTLMRLLFDEESEVVYPNEFLLKPSNGNWEKKRIMRVVVSGSNFSPEEFIGQKITGESSGATAFVESELTFVEGTDSVTEFDLDENQITGTFTSGETISAVSNTTDLTIKATVKSIVTSASVSTTGSLYTDGQTVNVITGSTGGNSLATVVVDGIGQGSVDGIVIDDAGTGFAVGDVINFNNTGTNGSGVEAKVTVVGGGIAPESGTVSAGGISATDHIVLEDYTGVTDQDRGNKIVVETGTFANLSVASEAGEITDIQITKSGSGYESLPLISSVTTSGGTGAKLKPFSNTIGTVQGLKVTNNGLNYASAPTLLFYRNAILKDITGTFAAGDSLTSHTGTVVSFDSDRQLLVVSLTVAGTWTDGTSITTSGASATIGHAAFGTGTTDVGIISTKDGDFLDEKGKVSESVMRIQDGDYYQDYSYEIKLGQSLLEYKNALYKTTHPTGWKVFGKVTVATLVSAQIKQPAGTEVSGFDGDDTFTPELASTFETIFSSVFGRRLGTSTDGSSLSSSPMAATDGLLTAGKRDVTLSSEYQVEISSEPDGRSSGYGKEVIANIALSAFTEAPVIRHLELEEDTGPGDILWKDIGDKIILENGTSVGLNAYGRQVMAESDTTNDYQKYPLHAIGGIVINQVSIPSEFLLETSQGDDLDNILLEDDTGGVLQFEVGIKSKIPTVAFTTEFKGTKIPANIPDNQFSQELFSSNQFTFDSSSLTFDDSTG